MSQEVVEHPGRKLTRRAALQLVGTAAGATILTACGASQPGSGAVVTMPLCSLLQVSVSTSKVHGIIRERSGGGLNLASTWLD